MIAITTGLSVKPERLVGKGKVSNSVREEVMQDFSILQQGTAEDLNQNVSLWICADQ